MFGLIAIASAVIVAVAAVAWLMRELRDAAKDVDKVIEQSENEQWE